MADEMNQMEFERLGIGSVLRRSRLFVPPNQREYAWTEREVSTLFRDYGRAVEDGSPYFLGTIVTISRPDGMLEVVDGQQRLATTSLLLAAIRDHLDDDMISESINSDFLISIDWAKRVRVPKLRLNVDDNELFERIITGSPSGAAPKTTRESHARLRTAYRIASEHVRKIAKPWDPWDHRNIFSDWVSFVDQSAFVVLIRMSNDAHAYRMFETLNDRGLRTSQADLIKNFLFSRSVDRVQEIRHRWHHMRGALETLGDEDITVDFLRAAVIVTRGHTRESQVYESVQNIAKTENTALGFASTIERLAHAYVATFISSHERWNGCPQGVRNAIDVLDLLDARAMRPLLLAAAGRFSRKELAATFRFAVALSVRLVVTGSPQGASVEMPLAQVANLVYRREIETTDSLKRELNGIIPSDEEFRAAFETARVPRAGLARYYLRSLERAANEESEPWYLPNEDSSIINLEHILPKKPEGNWPQFSDDEAAMYVDRLGNQALLRASDNSDVGNAGFADKRPLYEESPYRLTKMIAEAADWTPEQVIARQKRLAELALTAWPI